MAYTLPVFNAWGRAWRPDMNSDLVTDVAWTFLGYFPCQERSVPDHFLASVLLEVPPRLNFKKSTQTPFGLGMRVQVAGWGPQWARVYEVESIGAGFDNEHLCLLLDRPDDVTFDSNRGFYHPAVNPGLAPPPGFFLMGDTPPSEDWEDPDQTSPQWNSDGSV